MAVRAGTVTFEDIQVGDPLPDLVKHETQETIDRYNQLAQMPRRDWHNLHTDAEYAQGGIFAGTVNMGTATCGYMGQLLEMAFPVKSILNGGHFEMRATEPVHAGDTVTLTGEVTDKRQEDGQKLVEVELRGTNQLGQTVAMGRATVRF